MIEGRSHTGTVSLPYVISDAVLNHVTLKTVCHNLYTIDNNNKKITSIMHFEGHYLVHTWNGFEFECVIWWDFKLWARWNVWLHSEQMYTFSVDVFNVNWPNNGASIGLVGVDRWVVILSSSLYWGE